MTVAPVESKEVVQALGRAELDQTSMRLPADMVWEEYEAAAVALDVVSDAYPYWVGDLIVEGEVRFPERHAAAYASFFKLAPATLMYYASVARRVPPNRRRKELTHKHHACVMKLNAKEQARWLALAIKHQWTAAELRRQIKLELGEEEAGPSRCEMIEQAARGAWIASQKIELEGNDGKPETGYFVREYAMQEILAAIGELSDETPEEGEE